MRAADAAILILTLVISWTFYRAHRKADFAFNLFDLVMENGKLSRMACVFMGAFAVASWIVIRLTVDGKMTGEIFAAYGGIYVAPIIAKLFSSNPPAKETP